MSWTGCPGIPPKPDALRDAQGSIHLEVYAFALDSTGLRFVEALVGAVRRGFVVTAVIDGWGFLRLFVGIGRLRRNHRKLLLVDDRVRFIGGINIGDDYVDEAVRILLSRQGGGRKLLKRYLRDRRGVRVVLLPRVKATFLSYMRQRYAFTRSF